MMFLTGILAAVEQHELCRQPEPKAIAANTSPRSPAMVTDKQVEAAALALLNTGCVREPVAATESFMLSRARSMARAALEAAEAAAWETIESAPKDGRWFLAGETTTYDLVGGHTFHACTARFEYPSDDAPEVMRANGYDAGPTWPTHWRPLPQPPKETT